MDFSKFSLMYSNYLVTPHGKEMEPYPRPIKRNCLISTCLRNFQRLFCNSKHGQSSGLKELQEALGILFGWMIGYGFQIRMRDSLGTLISKLSLNHIDP